MMIRINSLLYLPRRLPQECQGSSIGQEDYRINHDQLYTHCNSSNHKNRLYDAIQQVIIILALVVALNVFYSKTFLTKSYTYQPSVNSVMVIETRPLSMIIINDPSSATEPCKYQRSDMIFNRNTSHSILWMIVLYHILYCHPAFEELIKCSLLSSMVQVFPFRKFCQKHFGQWPSILKPFMPTATVASSLRQSFGPPYVSYTIASYIVLSGGGTEDQFARDHGVHSLKLMKEMISMISVLSCVAAGVFIRPDNDWAGTYRWISLPMVHSNQRKRLHGCLMTISSGINLLLMLYSWK